MFKIKIREYGKTEIYLEQLARVIYDGLVQDCSKSSALAMDLLQSCNKPIVMYQIWSL